MNRLYNHQKTALLHIQNNDQYALFMEQGTCKTLPILLHSLNLYKSGAIKNALIIAPKAARGAWDRDIEKFFSPFDRMLFQKFLMVTTYDLIWRRKELDIVWDFICLDESHFIKSRTSNRYAGKMVTRINPETGKKKRMRETHGISDISRSAKYRYILTGTPIGNSHWEEIWAQFDFLDPDILGKYSDFEERYCILNQFFKPWRYMRVDELKRIIAAHSYRITKAECLDLPDKLPPERYTVEMLERSIYKQMLKNFIVELNIEAPNPLSRLTKLRQLCSGHILDEQGVGHNLKCDKPAALDEFLDNWDKKLVIFAEYKQSIRDITSILTKNDIYFVVLDGDQKDKNIWRQFQGEEDTQVIVCQYRTASAGIDLYAADTIIFYEPTLCSQVF